MDARRSETWFFVVLLALAVYLAWLILAPYIGALVLAGTLAFLFQPLYKKMLAAFRYESLTAFIIVILVVFIVFIPLGFFGLRIFTEATALYISLASHGGFNLGASLTKFLAEHFPNLDTTGFAASLNNYAQQGLTWLLQNLGSFFSGIAQLFFMAFVSLLGLFYFLKDGDQLEKWVFGVVPLASEYIEEIVTEVKTVGSSVVKGTLVVAIAQGLMMGLGFLFFGIPDPTFWGALTVLASIIPIVGAWLVGVPAIAYLFVTGQTAVGIGFAIWCLVFVNLIYNVLSPQLMHRGVNIHPYLILLSVIGGIGLFGPIGFLIGPLVMALLFSLLKIYPKLLVARSG